MKYLLLILPLLAQSCSYTYPIGTIGAKKLIKVQAGSLSGPTQTMIAIVDTNSNEITFLSPMGGNGVLSSVTVAGSIVAGSYFIGKGLERSHGDTTTISTSSESTSQAQSEAIASSISTPTVIVPDPPPAGPMLPRTRPPYGRAIGHSK